MENFDKYIGEYSTSGDLKTALEVGTLKTPFLALVGNSVNYNDIVYVDLYIDDNLRTTLPRSGNMWGVAGNFYKDSTLQFKVNGEFINFYVDGVSYSAYTLSTNSDTLVLTLDNNVFTLTYTDLGAFDVRVTMDNINYDLTYSQTMNVNATLGNVLVSNKVVYWCSGSTILDLTDHLNKERVAEDAATNTYIVDTLLAESTNPAGNPGYGAIYITAHKE